MPAIVMKKQILALTYFVGHAWHQIADSPEYVPNAEGKDAGLQNLVASLLRLTAARSEIDNVGPEDIQKAAHKSLSLGMGIIPVADFAAAISSMLVTDNSAVRLLVSVSISVSYNSLSIFPSRSMLQPLICWTTVLVQSLRNPDLLSLRL